MSNGCWEVRAAASAPFVVTEIDHGNGRDVRAQRHERRICGARLPLRILPGSKLRLPATARNSWAATARSGGRLDWSRGTRFPEKSARASIRAVRCRHRSNCGPADAAEIVFFLGQAENSEQARELRAADTARKTLNGVLLDVTNHWDDILDAVQITTPDRGDGYSDQSLAAVPDAVLPHLGPRRLLPIERRVRIPRSDSGCHGAHYGRMARIAARTYSAGRLPINSPPETFSTGGIRLRAAECARASPMTGCGFLTP